MDTGQGTTAREGWGADPALAGVGTAAPAAAPRRVVVIGAGPRGTSAVERIVSRAAAAERSARAEGGPAAGAGLGGAPRVRIDVVDPHEPGPGHVWATDQSRLFLMNTPSFYPTASPGFSFEDFRAAGGGEAELSEEEAAELEALGRNEFPPRALYGAYLRELWRRVVALAAATPSVDGPHHHARSAVAVDPEVTGGYRVVLDDGTVLHADEVVLALGHVPARLSPEQEAVGRASAGLGAGYLPPHVPADVDHSVFPAGEAVLVRGMGLNFFDLMIALSVGRGGRFESTGEPAGRALRYVPSGEEPVLVAGARRGAPYRAKSVGDSFVPHGVNLRHLSYERVVAAAGHGVAGRVRGTVDFDRHVWPLLQRDVVEHYYRALAQAEPHLFGGGPDGFLEELAQILDAPADIGDEVWTIRVRDLLREAAPEAEFFDIRSLARPFAGVGHTSAEGHAQAVIELLEADAAGAARGEADPEHLAIGALHAGRLLAKRLVAEGIVDERSVAVQVRGWFEPLVEGLASGPPLERIEQLAALARAGLVKIVGPEPAYDFDDERGVFAVSSPWVQAPPIEARWMVEAMMPANRVAVTDSALLRGTLASGLGRPRRRVTADGEEVPGSGLDVSGADRRLVGADGSVRENLHVLGLQLSSVQWGTAIAAEAGAGPHAGGLSLADADAVAASILTRAGIETPPAAGEAPDAAWPGWVLA